MYSFFMTRSTLTENTAMLRSSLDLCQAITLLYLLVRLSKFFIILFVIITELWVRELVLDLVVGDLL